MKQKQQSKAEQAVDVNYAEASQKTLNTTTGGLEEWVALAKKHPSLQQMAFISIPNVTIEWNVTDASPSKTAG